MSMELKLSPYTLPEAISFNYEELKAGITQWANDYHGITYTDDQLKDAKADLANVRRLKKALNDERIRVKKDFLKPFDAFEKRIVDLSNMVVSVETEINDQVVHFEDNRKAQKKDQCVELFYSDVKRPDWLDFEQIFDKRWLNKSFELSKVRTAINDCLVQIEAEMATLGSLPEFGFEAQAVYQKCLDVNKAIAEAQRMAEIQRQKDEAKRRAEEETPSVSADGTDTSPKGEAESVPDVRKAVLEKAAVIAEQAEAEKWQWVNFSARLTVDKAKLLKRFCDVNGIELKSI